MSTLDDYYYLGKIIKPKGFKGKVNIYLDTDEPESYENLKLIYLVAHGMPVPYFVESIQIVNNKATISLRDVDTLEKAQLLTQKDIYLPLSDLPQLTGNKFYYHEVNGYSVIDKNQGYIGKVKQVLEYPNQAVLQVVSEGREILIPVNNEVILQVDRDKNEIQIDAPDGLIDIYK